MLNFFLSLSLLTVFDSVLIDEFVGQGGEVPYAEMFGTFALSVGAAVSVTTYHSFNYCSLFFRFLFIEIEENCWRN